ncbi:MAG: hypothetical protein GF344_07720 [Chitinivibrionales bacterium]|nr:hypothetical protein [Chitinivibrionales bacterium]MBD3356787.1 hypothetical protein [Chitinivibrionales bacterium]
MKKYDITFVGHMCIDEIEPYGGERKTSPGSAVLCGAVAAKRIGKEILAITKMNPADEWVLDALKKEDIDTIVIPAEETTYMVVEHPSENLDERVMYQKKSAGHFIPEEMPSFESTHVHCAGITDQEFTLELMAYLKDKGYTLSNDMQSFVRQVDAQTREISFSDVSTKKEIASYSDKLKMDIVEARILTGEEDIARAAAVIHSWGCPEIIITESKGVLAYADGKSYYQPFTNKNSLGRTGRGDTTFGGYVSRRQEFGIEDSLKFASALASIKMESPGPFSGTLDDVLSRMAR